MKTRQNLPARSILALMILFALIVVQTGNAQPPEDIYGPVNYVVIKFTEHMIEMPEPDAVVGLQAIHAHAEQMRSILTELDPGATISRRYPKFDSSDTLKINRLGEIIRQRDRSLVYRIDFTKYVPFFEVKEAIEVKSYVEWVSPPVMIKTQVLPNDIHKEGHQWYLPKVKAPQAWDITQGDENILIQIMDFGIGPHDDIENKVVNYGRPYSGNHGVSVAGVAGAETDNNFGIASLGWETMLVDASFEEYFIPFYFNESYDTDSEWYADIINCSFFTIFCYSVSGGVCVDYESYNIPEVEVAVADAIDNGRIIVAAAGNPPSQYQRDSVPYTAWPAAYPGVIAVSATNASDEFPSGYNYGNFVDLGAPSIGIRTLDNNNNYHSPDGTSFGAPLVSATIALMLSLNPTLTPDLVRTILQESADKVPGMGGQYYTQQYGYGRLNSYQALHPIVAIDGPHVIYEWDEYTWTAESYGGDGNYTYDWYRRIDHQTLTCHYQTEWSHVGSASSYSSFVNDMEYDFQLKVEVQSASLTTTEYFKVYPANNENIVCPEWVGEKDVASAEVEVIPEHYTVADNYPNPFNPVTTIRYELPEPSHVTLIIYDMMGREVRRLVNDVVEPGNHTATWDSRNNAGTVVSSGMYLYRFTATPAGGKSEDTGITESNTMLLVK